MPKKHTHPFAILQMIWRFFPLLIFPLARGFISALSGGSVALWLDGAWKDMIIIAAIFSLGIGEWWRLRYNWDEKGLTVYRGIFLCRRLFISVDKIITMSLTRPFYLRPLGAARLRVDTWAGGKKNMDVSLFLPVKEASEIFSKRCGAGKSEQSDVREYRPKTISVILLAAILSNSIAGVLFLASFISETGSLLGREFSKRITDTFEWLTRIIAWGIPPATVALAYLIILGWLFTFIRNFINRKNFTVCRAGDQLQIKCGIITLHNYSVRLEEINYVDIRQTLITKALGLYSAFISAVGYEREKEGVCAIVPANFKDRLAQKLSWLLPEFAESSRQIRPNFGAILRFLCDPMIPTIIIPIAGSLLTHLFPGWGDFIHSLVIMALFPCAWFITVRIFDFFTSGIGRKGDTFTLRYSQGWNLHTIIVPQNRIAQVVFRQSPIQAFDRRCDVLVYTLSEGHTCHHIRNLDVAQVMEIFSCNETNAEYFSGRIKPFISLTEYLHPFSNYMRPRKPIFGHDKTGKNGRT